MSILIDIMKCVSAQLLNGLMCSFCLVAKRAKLHARERDRVCSSACSLQPSFSKLFLRQVSAFISDPPADYQTRGETREVVNRQVAIRDTEQFRQLVRTIFR